MIKKIHAQTVDGIPTKVSPAIEKLNRILELAHNASDERTLTLALSSYAEDVLERLLLLYLRPIPGPKSEAQALVRGFNSPLGTLSARIKGAYAIGLISIEQYEDLDKLRRVRNEFAHNWEGISFDKQRLASLIDGMHESRIDSGKGIVLSSRQEKLISSICGVLVELEMGLIRIKTQKFVPTAMHQHVYTTVMPSGKQDSS